MGDTNHNEMIRLLMTGAGAPGAAGILKCLGLEPRFHITAADANPHAVGRYRCDDFVQIPYGDDPGFADALLEVCREKQIRTILPLVTRELIPLAENAGRFAEAGTQVLVSPASSLAIANNKSRLYQFLEWRGLPVPEYRVVETVEQFRQAANDLGYPKIPFCFKPSVSNGSRGFRVVAEGVDESDLLFNQKPQSTYMRYDDAVRILSARPFPELLLSEYLPGEEYSVDCIALNGEMILALPRWRKRMINGISVEGEFREEPALQDYCRVILRELRLHGNIGIQVKRNAAGEFRILEINPRVQGTISSALGAGVNLPVLGVKLQLGWPVAADEMRVKWGTGFSRYWEEVFY